MKKKILYIAAIIICLSIITGGTFAYYTTSDVARNTISSAAIKDTVHVYEQQLVGGVLQPYPNTPIPVMPATSVSKIVSAKSTGDAVWVRMNYSVSVKDAQGKEMELSADDLAKVIIIEAGGDNWIYSDGWWYYKSPIKSGDITEPLFEEVAFSGPNMDNRYQNTTALVNVNVQAVQQAHNGASVMEALGWPAN